MHVDAIVAALDGGEELFALEQRVRRSSPAVADMIVAHRFALRADGSRALLQRLARPVGALWLEPLTPEPIVGQPLWGHEGKIAWMRADEDQLVTRGADDGRLRRFDVHGVCHEDREATALDDARRLGDALVFLVDGAVELRALDGGALRETIALPKSDDYRWIEAARVLEDGTVALKFGEDYPGSLYGPSYEWHRFDPRDGSQARMSAPSEQVTVAGRVAVALADGTIRLVADPTELERAREHDRPVRVVALGPGRFVSGADDGIRVHDRDGALLAKGDSPHRGIAQIILADPIVTTSTYLHQSSAYTRPHARLWGASTAKAGRRLDAGDRYQDFISCDPTGTRVAFTVGGVLHLCEIGRRKRTPKRVPLTWHWGRRIAWSPDGLRLAVQHHGRAPTVWNLARGERERILTTDVLDSAHFGVSEDGAVVTVDHSFYRLRAIRVADGVALRSLEPGLNVRCSASRGTKGVCGGVEGGFWFDLATNQRIRHKQGPWIHACHVSGPIAAMAGSDGVYAIELDSGELLWRWACDEAEQHCVAVLGDRVVSLDARGLLTTLVDGEIELQRMSAPPTPGESSDQPSSMCALPDHSVLVGCPDGWIRRWDPVTGDLVDDYDLGGGPISALSTGGGKVLCRRGREHGEGEWLAFELDGGAPVALPAGANCPRLTPDGERLISLDLVARLDVLDARTAEVLDHREFGSWVAAEHLAFEDGEVRPRDEQPITDGVLTVSARGGTIEVTRAGEVVARVVAPREWTCVAIDGDRVAAGDSEGHLSLWALHRDEPETS